MNDLAELRPPEFEKDPLRVDVKLKIGKIKELYYQIEATLAKMIHVGKFSATTHFKEFLALQKDLKQSVSNCSQKIPYDGGVYKEAEEWMIREDHLENYLHDDVIKQAALFFEVEVELLASIASSKAAQDCEFREKLVKAMRNFKHGLLKTELFK